METMPVALFGDGAKAEAVLQRLVQAGFGAILDERPRLTTLWFVPKKKACVRVEVPTDQFERAEQSLLDWDASEGALGGAIRCPECHSLRVEYPQYAEHSLLTNLALGLLAEVRLLEKHFYCQDCHYTWPKEGTKARRDRPHLAPYYFIEGVEQSTLGAKTSQPPQEHRQAA